LIDSFIHATWQQTDRRHIILKTNPNLFRAIDLYNHVFLKEIHKNWKIEI